MSKFSILGLFIAIAMMFTIGCSGDDDDDVADVNCGSNWFASDAVQNALNDFSSAATAYGSNPTSENCNAYKDAADDYIDVLESFRGCAVDQGVLAEWEQSFDDARNSIDALEC
ncbi:MAG: hypothetical protein GVX96_04370 [Bacteroidetes bacterium]|nr:hypothetical protein [Bacteroidota bacterium]